MSLRLLYVRFINVLSAANALHCCTLERTHAHTSYAARWHFQPHFDCNDAPYNKETSKISAPCRLHVAPFQRTCTCWGIPADILWPCEVCFCSSWCILVARSFHRHAGMLQRSQVFQSGSKPMVRNRNRHLWPVSRVSCCVAGLLQKTPICQNIVEHSSVVLTLTVTHSLTRMNDLIQEWCVSPSTTCQHVLPKKVEIVEFVTSRLLLNCLRVRIEFLLARFAHPGDPDHPATASAGDQFLEGLGFLKFGIQEHNITHPTWRMKIYDDAWWELYFTVIHRYFRTVSPLNILANSLDCSGLLTEF